MTARAIAQEARRWGLRLERRGEDKVAIVSAPGANIPPEFVELVREHKAAVLSWLEAAKAYLRPDEAPWLHVAKQVLAGEFDGLMDSSMCESLTIGLRSIRHPVCQRALERLNKNTGDVA